VEIAKLAPEASRKAKRALSDLNRQRKKRSQRVALAELHAMCELNYARLLRVFPDYQRSNSRRIQVASSLLVINVIERDRHTTCFAIDYHTPLPAGVGNSCLHIRMYHDAEMAEVVKLKTNSRLEPRYSYPNNRMYQPDEKWQQNQFVAELLEACLSDGQTTDAVFTVGES